MTFFLNIYVEKGFIMEFQIIALLIRWGIKGVEGGLYPVILLIIMTHRRVPDGHAIVGSITCKVVPATVFSTWRVHILPAINFHSREPGEKPTHPCWPGHDAMTFFLERLINQPNVLGKTWKTHATVQIWTKTLGKRSSLLAVWGLSFKPSSDNRNQKFLATWVLSLTEYLPFT